MSQRDANILCHLVGGPFDGQTLEERSTTLLVALQSPTNEPELWALYRRSQPDVLLQDDLIEFTYIGMRDRPFE